MKFDLLAQLWVLIPLVLMIRGFFVEPYKLSLREERVYIEDLPRSLEGVCLLHLTDLHLRGNEAYDRRLVNLIREAAPDLVVLTGDYLDDLRRLPELTRVISQISGCYPVLAVLGDNDMPEAARIQSALEEGGARVLRNEGEHLEIKSATLYVAGIDDPRFTSSDLVQALKKRGQEAVPAVLLSHSAEIFPQALANDVDLLLCGHTHSGQVCLPLWGALYTNDRLGRRYASGLLREGQLQIHVSTGVGWAKLPVRLFCLPEVVRIRLRRGQSSQP